MYPFNTSPAKLEPNTPSGLAPPANCKAGPSTVPTPPREPTALPAKFTGLSALLATLPSELPILPNPKPPPPLILSPYAGIYLLGFICLPCFLVPVLA